MPDWATSAWTGQGVGTDPPDRRDPILLRAVKAGAPRLKAFRFFRLSLPVHHGRAPELLRRPPVRQIGIEILWLVLIVLHDRQRADQILARIGKSG